MPHGRVETLDRRPGGLQAWGRRPNTHSAPQGPLTEPIDNQQTRPKDCPGRVRARARPDNPPPTPRLPCEDHFPPVGQLMAPHRCPHWEEIPNDIFLLPPIQSMTLTPTPL